MDCGRAATSSCTEGLLAAVAAKKLREINLRAKGPSLHSRPPTYSCNAKNEGY